MTQPIATTTSSPVMKKNVSTFSIPSLASVGIVSDVETGYMDAPIPKSDFYTLRSTPGAGRGVFATKPIEAGTLLLRTSRASQADDGAVSWSESERTGAQVQCEELLSPTAYTILRPYRLEVCAECFAYDRGRKWKVKLDEKSDGQDGKSACRDTGLVFCTDRCRDGWIGRYRDVGIAGFAAVEEAVKRLTMKTKRKPQLSGGAADKDVSSEDKASSYVDDGHKLRLDEVNRHWVTAEWSALQITRARENRAWTKSTKRLAREAAEPEEVDADILYHLLTGVMNTYLATHDAKHREQSASMEENTPESSTLALNSILSLTPDDQCYEHPASTLYAYTESYLLLIAILPIELSKGLTPHLCHELCTRASHNAFSIRPAGGTDGEQSGEFLGWGVWPEASFFNHSCACNVIKERRGRVWEFRTNKAIAEGEQLCITYLGGDEKDFDTAKRRKTLRDSWGFWCACSRCADDD